MSVSKLLQIIHEEAGKQSSNTNFIGEISSVNPLKVKMNSIELDSDQLKISSSVEEVEYIDTVLTIKKLKDALKVGDEVILLKVGTVFIIVSRLEG